MLRKIKHEFSSVAHMLKELQTKSHSDEILHRTTCKIKNKVKICQQQRACALGENCSPSPLSLVGLKHQKQGEEGGIVFLFLGPTCRSLR